MVTKGIGRPLVQIDIDRAYESMARAACAIINEEQKEATPQLAFIQVDDTKPGELLDLYMLDPRLVMSMFGSAKGKQLLTSIIAATLGDEDSPFAAMLRPAMTTNGLRPDIAVQVSEAWVAPDNNTPIAPSMRADRQEALVVMVHVKGHTTGRWMPIKTTDGKRHVDYLPLPTTAQGGIMGGDMAMQQWDDLPEGLRK